MQEEVQTDAAEAIIGGPAPSANGAEDPAAALAGSLKVALASTLPGLDPSAIVGASAEEIAASFAALRSAVLNARPMAVPAGAPGRTQAVPLTPFAKIREGLARI